MATICPRYDDRDIHIGWQIRIRKKGYRVQIRKSFGGEIQQAYLTSPSSGVEPYIRPSTKAGSREILASTPARNGWRLARAGNHKKQCSGVLQSCRT